MKLRRKILLFLLVVIIVGVIAYIEFNKPTQSNLTTVIQTSMDNAKEKKYKPASELQNIAGYINTNKILINELIGKKVILVDFWTYSCINCQRTLPYLTAWYDKYKDQGLEIIGVHTPEFAFEKELANVTKAVNQYNIKYPIVLDNDYGTWRAYQNNYWPRKYLIDIDGYVVYDHIGEGGYAETEKKIQDLLAERKTVLSDKVNLASGMVKPENTETVGFAFSRSPEIYFGAWRNNYLGNGQQLTKGVQIFNEPAGVKANILYLKGNWDIAQEYAENKSGQAKIIFRYQAGKVFMVAESLKGVNIKIYRDGKLVDKNAGVDVKNGSVFIKNSQLYKLIDEGGGHGEHTLEIIIENPGLKAYTFTFG